MHKSVLLQETIDFLAPKTGGAYIDATAGAGGHSSEILKKIGPKGRLLAIDKDERALEIARDKLRGDNVTLVRGDFSDIEKLARENGFGKVDGILADLGVSSMQLDEAERGFSFSKHARLDMRMDNRLELTAEKVISEYKEEDLTRIFRKYGEEEEARKIAREIVKIRETNPIIWTDQLSEVVRRVKKIKTKIDPATKVFQALRIEVNKELLALESALPQMVSLLSKNGRLVIISFHSLEDRIVKQFIEEELKNAFARRNFRLVSATKKQL